MPRSRHGDVAAAAHQRVAHQRVAHSPDFPRGLVAVSAPRERRLDVLHSVFLTCVALSCFLDVWLRRLLLCVLRFARRAILFYLKVALFCACSVQIDSLINID